MYETNIWKKYKIDANLIFKVYACPLQVYLFKQILWSFVLFRRTSRCRVPGWRMWRWRRRPSVLRRPYEKNSGGAAIRRRKPTRRSRPYWASSDPAWRGVAWRNIGRKNKNMDHAWNQSFNTYVVYIFLCCFLLGFRRPTKRTVGKAAFSLWLFPILFE